MKESAEGEKFLLVRKIAEGWKKYQWGAIGQLEYEQATPFPKISGTWQLVQGLLITVKPHFAFIHIDVHAD